MERTVAPDTSRLEIPADAWTQAFWDGTERSELLIPRCGACRHHRWPPGPFCPSCRSQQVDWVAAGPGRIYSFTIVRAAAPEPGGSPIVTAPALIEFPEAGGVRLIAALVDADPATIAIGAPVEVRWSATANRRMPVFAPADAAPSRA